MKCYTFASALLIATTSLVAAQASEDNALYARDQMAFEVFARSIIGDAIKQQAQVSTQNAREKVANAKAAVGQTVSSATQFVPNTIASAREKGAGALTNMAGKLQGQQQQTRSVEDHDEFVTRALDDFEELQSRVIQYADCLKTECAGKTVVACKEYCGERQT